MAEKETKTAEVKPLAEEKVVTEAKAKLLNYGVTPRKVRLVIDLVRGKDLDTAYAILENCSKMCAKDIEKLIKSAEANAVNNFDLSRDKLYVAECISNPGPVLKRYIPRARGSASSIKKRTSHVTVVLKERV